MARSPQSFEKRQRERRKQLKREEKFERRLIRAEEKRLRKENGGVLPDSEEDPDADGGDGHDDPLPSNDPSGH